MKDAKIKLTFHRVHSIGRGGSVNQKYQLSIIENAVIARIGNTVSHTNYRVGDLVPEVDVQWFVDSKRDYEVKVKS